MLNRIHHRLEGRSGKGLAILGILCVSLILRGDDGCVTEDKNVEGVLAVTLKAEWTTEGFTENTDQDGGNAGDFADEIFDALDELEDAGDLQADGVTVAGARGRVTANNGHSSARTATVNITTSSFNGEAFDMRVPDNNTGREVTASDNGANLYLDLNATAVNALNGDFQDFLAEYLAGDRNAARLILNGINWTAVWSTDNPPTQQDPDDFDWETEIILHVPVEYEVTVPSL